MTKKHFKALADAIKSIPVWMIRVPGSPEQGTPFVLANEVLDAVIEFCQKQNKNFDAVRFREVVSGAVEKPKVEIIQ